MNAKTLTAALAASTLGTQTRPADQASSSPPPAAEVTAPASPAATTPVPDYRVGWGIPDSPLRPVRSPEKNLIVLRQNGPPSAPPATASSTSPEPTAGMSPATATPSPEAEPTNANSASPKWKFDPDGNILPPHETIFNPGDPVPK